MKNHLVRILLSLLLGGVLTGATYYFNTRKSIAERTELALRWAQQIVAQIETLQAHAREKIPGESLDWAIEALAVGPEDRPVQIAPLRPSSAVQEPEKFKLNTKTGVFSYFKIMNR